MNGTTMALLAGGLIAAGGVGTAIGDLGDRDRDRPPQELEVRKDDGFDDVELVDEDDDGKGDGSRDDRSGDRSGASLSQDPQTGSGDNTARTAQTAGTGYQGDTGDGDATAGNDGSAGGDNSYVAPAADEGYVAPAPAAPVYYGDDGGSYSGGGSDG